MTFRMSLRG